MKLHRNARTTPMSRRQIVERVLTSGWTYEQAADGSGVSRRTVAKWIRRFRAAGLAGLEDASSRPRRMPSITATSAVTRIRRLRERHGLPAWAISRAVGVPRSTVSAWLRRLGLNRYRPVPAVPVQRYEWPVAGDLLHLDIKPLGRFRQPGHRIHGNRRVTSPRAGWEYVHVAIDDCSRLAYVEVCANQLGATCAAFLHRAVAWFAAHAVRVQRVMSDNGSGYVSRAFREACATLALRHLRTRAYTPRTNGKAERFIQTLLREWAYVQSYRSSGARRQALPAWLRFYNQQRPHASLDYQPPWSRLQSAA
jgi:transposase InsO family protein